MKLVADVLIIRRPFGPPLEARCEVITLSFLETEIPTTRQGVIPSENQGSDDLGHFSTMARARLRCTTRGQQWRKQQVDPDTPLEGLLNRFPLKA